MPGDVQTLRNWNQISANFPNSALLMGNGQSLAVCSRFGYGTLYNVACNQIPNLASRLSPAEQNVFVSLGNTRNFEYVLSSLKNAETVISATAPTAAGQAIAAQLRNHYIRIRQALFLAINHVHIAQQVIAGHQAQNVFSLLFQGFSQHTKIFTTNYDLILYWSMLSQQAIPFIDYFWNKPFDSTDTEAGQGKIPVHYLHGAIHLFVDNSGGTVKRTAAINHLLSDPLPPDPCAGLTPLLVSEGIWQDKMLSIRSNSYLAFCFNELYDNDDALVVVGHSLTAAHDQHICDAIRKSNCPAIAIGQFTLNKTPQQLLTERHQMMGLLDDPARQITFFDVQTCPLGSPALFVL